MFGTYRTILALMVVFLHLGGVPRIGAYAVFGFYCLSGYLMTLIMQTTYGYSFQGVIKYGINRFLRIYPLYWLSILFSIILIWQLGEGFTSKYHRSMFLPADLTDYLKNFALFFPGRGNPRLTPPAWALTVEIFFYILIGLGLSRNKIITIIWLVLSVAYHVFVAVHGYGWKYQYFIIPAASLPFATGAMIFHYKQTFNRYLRKAPDIVYSYLPYIVLIGVFINWSIGKHLSLLKGVFFYTNYLLCALMVVLLSERKELPKITRKFDKLMGDFSYPIYLIHYQVGILVIVCFSAFGVELRRPDQTFMMVSIPVILLCSWLITISFERPIERLRTKIKTPPASPLSTKVHLQSEEKSFKN